MENQKGNLYLIIAIIVGVVAIGATGFASWKYFGGGSELEKNGNEITKPLIEKETEKSETITEISNWKTYNSSSSAMYSFEEYTIKYPYSWSYKEERKLGSRKVGILNTTFHNQKKEKKLSISAGEIFGEYSNKSLQKIQLGDNLFYKYQNNDEINYIYKTGIDRDIDENIETIIVFSFQNKDQKIIQQIFKSFNPLIDDVMNWKTYRNDQYGFEIKYPSFCEVEETFNIGGFYRPDANRVSFSPSKISMQIYIESWTKFGEGFTTLQEWSEERKDRLSDPAQGIHEIFELEEENITLNKVSAKKISVVNTTKFGKFRWVEIFTQQKERMYEIYTEISFDQQDIGLPIFNQMLSTFKF